MADQRFYNEALAWAAEHGEELSQAELDRRAVALRKLHYERMVHRSIQARRAKRQAAQTSKSPTSPPSAGLQEEGNRGLHTAAAPPAG
jgi:hypothetical protein